MYWDFGDSSGAGRVFTTYDIAWNGTWTHWLFTSDNPSGMKIYRNGTEIAASPSSSTFNTSSSVLDIGYYASGNTYWSGSIDDIRIYDRALSAAEAAALFNEGAL